MNLASFAPSNYATGGDVTFTISFVFYFSFSNFCCYLWQALVFLHWEKYSSFTCLFWLIKGYPYSSFILLYTNGFSTKCWPDHSFDLHKFCITEHIALYVCVYVCVVSSSRGGNVVTFLVKQILFVCFVYFVAFVIIVIVAYFNFCIYELHEFHLCFCISMCVCFYIS